MNATEDRDPYLHLLSKNGEELAADDNGGAGNNALLTYWFRTSTYDTYLIDADWLGEAGPYTLSTKKNEPDVITPTLIVNVSDTSKRIWEFSGDPGDLVTIAMDANEDDDDPFLRLLSEDGEELVSDDDWGMGTNALIGYQLPEEGNYLIDAGWAGAAGPYSLTMRIKPEEIAPGILITVTDPTEKYWWFKGDQGDLVTISMDAQSSTEDADPYLRLLGQDGEVFASNDDGGEDYNALLDFRLPESGTYIIDAGWYESSGGWSPYELKMDQIAFDDYVSKPLSNIDEVNDSLPADEQVYWDLTGGLTQTVAINFTEPVTDVVMILYPLDSSTSALRQSTEHASILYSGVQEPGDYLLALQNPATGSQVDYSLSYIPIRSFSQVCGVDASELSNNTAIKEINELIAKEVAVILGHHRPFDGNEYWADDMAKFVGKPSIIQSLDGTDSTGCPIVRVSIDENRWLWRIRDMFVIED